MPALAEDLSGSLLSTFCIAIFLYGTATSQIYNYWQNFPYDYKLHRWTVGVVWLIDTIHTLYSCSITQNFTLSAFWSLAVMLAGIVQRFKFDIITQFRQNPSPVITASCGLSSAAAIDLLLAITLVYYRLKTPRRAHEKLHVVEALQYYLVNTRLKQWNLLVSYWNTRLVSLTIIPTFTHMWHTLVFAGLIQVQAKSCQNVRKFKLQSRKQEI
ncbi:predicted protein [Postia placenta Mad-698-R]|nr:predicted protein [Postia placenta Mad-698-R]